MRGQLWRKGGVISPGGERGWAGGKGPKLSDKYLPVRGIFVDKQSPITGKAITEEARGAEPLVEGLCMEQGRTPHLATHHSFNQFSIIVEHMSSFDENTSVDRKLMISNVQSSF